jgi:cysteine desulfuration protein SufE
MTDSATPAAERLNRIVEMFAAVPKNVRLEALLDYSRRLPPLPDRLTDHPELFVVVPECQSPFSLIVEQDGDVVRLFFRVPPEAPTVRGYAGILHEALDGAPANEILDVPDDFYVKMGLQEAVSSQRLNGMAAILRRIKAQVTALETAV